MLEAHGACEQEQLAGVMHMLKVVVHAAVLAVGLLDGKNAQVTSESKISVGLMERKKPEPIEQRNDKNEQSDENSKVDFDWGSEKWFLLMQNAVGRALRMYCPAPGTQNSPKGTLIHWTGGQDKGVCVTSETLKNAGGIHVNGVNLYTIPPITPPWRR